MGHFFKKLKVHNVSQNDILMSGTANSIDSSGVNANEISNAIRETERIDGIEDRVQDLENITDDIAERLHSING